MDLQNISIINKGEKMSYFNNFEKIKDFNKMLMGIILIQTIFNIIIVKSLISVAENKDIKIQVPYTMDKGKYTIGTNSASDNVYKMWVKIWLNDITNFSHNNIRTKMESIFPFLDTQTAFKNKAELVKFIEFVESNFISQKYRYENLKIEDDINGMKKITAFGRINRKIGNTNDHLNGLKYSYKFLTYVKNGQIYIKSIKTNFYGLKDKFDRNAIENNKFINLKDTIN
jgi:hypothetical protein